MSFEPKIKKMLIHEDLSNIEKNMDDMKRRMDEEFEQFQQYLRNEKKTFGELYTKVRVIERQATDIKMEILDPGSVEGFSDASPLIKPSGGVMMSAFATALAKKNPALALAMQGSKQKDESPERHDSMTGDGLSKTVNTRPKYGGGGGQFGNFVKQKDFDKIVTEFSEKLEMLDGRLSENFDTLLLKADKTEIGILTADKVKKDELQELMPDVDVIEARIKTFVVDMNSDASRKQLIQFRDWEQKLIKIRSDIDVEGINKRIHGKADSSIVDNDLQNHEFKISTLDTNVMALVGDITGINDALNQMHASLLELQDVNKDVLLGKKSINCLSCGKDDGLPSK